MRSVIAILAIASCAALQANSPLVRRGNGRPTSYSGYVRMRRTVFAIDSDAETSSSTPETAPADEPMTLLDYTKFFGTIAGFMVFFYAVAALAPK